VGLPAISRRRGAILQGGGGGDGEGVLDAADDVQAGQGGFDHDDVGAFVEVEFHLAEGFV